ncbi:MFS transporter [Microbacterium mangrovi]|uniref:MFS transporter n=1 Tax=Microbacterium mangrovi TaxID=1348253 RepID=A0A0B2A3I6_9MICO|nr:MFS transporter [Microbacterium mangrovi]KHK97615.1 MFS transporter [Microbacterium mangrovi]
MSQSVDLQPRSLWRDRNFLTMWGGQALSQFGEQISLLGVPVLAVVLLHSSAFEVGVLNASGLAAFLLIGLPAGAWIDRMRKRHVMIAADVVRAVALASVPILWSLGMLHIWQLYAVAFVIGVATVFFDVSYQSLTPSLVLPEQIAEANGKLEATAQVAHLTGPAIAGWLIGVFSAPFAMITTAGTYAASFVALSFTRDREQLRPAHEHGRLLHEIGEGLRWVFGSPALRRIVGTTGASNLFNTISVTILPLFLLRELGMTPQAMGLLLSLGAVGGLLGAIATPHLTRWVGEGPAIPLSALAFCVVGVLLPVAAMVPQIAFPLLVVAEFVMSFFVLVYNITQVTFRQRITPPRLLGRMNASIRFVVWGVMPIASLAAGALATWLGIVPTMWIGALGQLASAVFVVTGPFWAMRSLPTGTEAPAPDAT